MRPMTLAELYSLRKFLVRVVARGPEEEELVQLINTLDVLIQQRKAA
jgi:hypothetical protein